jgi:hypothetical protein
MCVLFHGRSAVVQGCFVLASYGNKSHKVGLSFQKSQGNIIDTKLFAMTEHYAKALPIGFR